MGHGPVRRTSCHTPLTPGLRSRSIWEARAFGPRIAAPTERGAEFVHAIGQAGLTTQQVQFPARAVVRDSAEGTVRHFPGAEKSIRTALEILL
jgi:hypothetical protein